MLLFIDAFIVCLLCAFKVSCSKTPEACPLIHCKVLAPWPGRHTQKLSFGGHLEYCMTLGMPEFLLQNYALIKGVVFISTRFLRTQSCTT